MGGGSKRRNKAVGEGGGGVCVLTFCRHSEKKTGSSFQTPVQAKEWVSSVKESDTELSQVFFKYSIVGKSPPPPTTTFSPISCYLLASWLEAGWPRAAWGGVAAAADVPRPLLPSRRGKPARPRANPKNRLFWRKPPSPRKAASQKKALQNQKLIKTFK